MNDINNLRKRSLINRSLYIKKQLTLRSPQSFKFLGYDLTTGKYRLQASNGGIYYADAMTNGGVRAGEIIRLRAGSIFSGFDAMPRVRRTETLITTTANQQSQPLILKIKTLFYLSDDELFYIGGDRSQVRLENEPISVFYGHLFNLGGEDFKIYSSNIGQGSYLIQLIIDDDQKLNSQITSAPYGFNNFWIHRIGSKINAIRKIAHTLNGFTNISNNIIENNSIINISSTTSSPTTILDKEYYGWEYFNQGAFPEEYERTFTINSKLNGDDTTLSLTYQNILEEIFLEDVEPTNVFPFQSELDNIWYTYFELLEPPNPSNLKDIYIITNKITTYTITGQSTVFYTSTNGFINQNYEASLDFSEGYENIGDQLDGFLYNVWRLKNCEIVIAESLNEIILKLNSEDSGTQLNNTSSFGSFPIASFLIINNNQFTFTFNDLGFKQSSGQNFDASVFESNPAYVAHSQVYNLSTSSYEDCIIKGTISNYIISVQEGVFSGQNVPINFYTVTCDVESIERNRITSFPYRIILNTGSIYNFLFRKDGVRIRTSYNFGSLSIPLASFNVYNPDKSSAYFISTFQPFVDGWISRETRVFCNQSLPFKFLDMNFASILLSTYYTQKRTYSQPNREYLDKYFKEFFRILQHNLDDVTFYENKIYCVTNTVENKGYVEQWDINDNGDVLFNSVFEIDYIQPEGDDFNIIAHSYYP